MHKVISGLFTCAALAAVLTSSAAADDKGRKIESPKTPPAVEKGAAAKVALQVDAIGSQEFPKYRFVNNTGATLPAGTKVYWKKNSQMQGVETLKSALPNGANFVLVMEAQGNNESKMTAWYYKQQ